MWKADVLSTKITGLLKCKRLTLKTKCKWFSLPPDKCKVTTILIRRLALFCCLLLTARSTLTQPECSISKASVKILFITLHDSQNQTEYEGIISNLSEEKYGHRRCSADKWIFVILDTEDSI